MLIGRSFHNFKSRLVVAALVFITVEESKIACNQPKKTNFNKKPKTFLESMRKWRTLSVQCSGSIRGQTKKHLLLLIIGLLYLQNSFAPKKNIKC